MADSNGKRPFSIHAFIEQTAQMLRDAAKSLQKKKRKVAKENGISNTNKISQIALMLRSQVKRRKNRKKSKD